MIEHHGGGEHEDEPFDAERKESGVLEFGVDGADQDGACEKAGDDGSGNEQNDGSDGVSEIGKDEEGDLRLAGISGVEGRDADEDTEDDAGPESSASDEGGGAM